MPVASPYARTLPILNNAICSRVRSALAALSVPPARVARPVHSLRSKFCLGGWGILYPNLVLTPEQLAFVDRRLATMSVHLTPTEDGLGYLVRRSK